MRLTGIALLNYAVPRLDSDTIGLAISTGPVLQLNTGSSDVSNLGYFAGLSVHFWRRLFLTPGWHVGQFSDFPTGLYPGDTIPQNYGNLTGVNRWSARFAFAITYRVADLSKVIKKPAATTSKTPPPAAPAGK
jgi:hypothetical protein